MNIICSCSLTVNNTSGINITTITCTVKAIGGGGSRVWETEILILVVLFSKTIPLSNAIAGIEEIFTISPNLPKIFGMVEVIFYTLY